MFNLNSKNLVGKTEYFDKLMAELKTLMKNKQKDTEGKSKRFSHENVDPEKVRCFPQPNVSTLVRPQPTNPKAFWRKFQEEDFSSTSKNVKNSYLEDKVTNNFFKPIRSEISPASKITPVKRQSKKKELAGKVDKSIHESLRIQKSRRRTSLPFFWNDDVNQGLIPAVEKVQTYDFSYYSSILKRMNQEKTQYYSSTRKNGMEKNFPIKSASDEKLYEEKLNKVVKEHGNKSERISVTEPSSPLPSDCLVENRKVNSSDSEVDSESTGSDVVLEIKKSKSFVDEKEADGYFKAKSRSSACSWGLSKTSQSSTSSYDSAYKTRSLRKQTKNKRKSDVRNSCNFDCPKNQYGSAMTGKDMATYRKVSDSEVVKRERSQSTPNRDMKRDEEIQKMKENVFKHLIEALMEKNRSEITNEKQTEFSKSLPRNTRRWKNDRYEEECLQVLRSVLEQESWAKSQQLKYLDNNTKKTSEALQRRRKGNEGESRGKNAQRVLVADAAALHKSSETLPKKKNSRGKFGTHLNDECVFAIEDKKLWIEICKAVEKVDGKGKVAKKCA